MPPKVLTKGNQDTLNYAPIMIGAISIISLIGWVLPFGLGGRHWFKGPARTISDQDFARSRIEGGWTEEEAIKS